MFKNITWSNLFGSKSFWGSFLTLVAEALKALFPANAKALLVVQMLTALLATIGFIDRTATPNAGK